MEIDEGTHVQSGLQCAVRSEDLTEVLELICFRRMETSNDTETSDDKQKAFLSE